VAAAGALLVASFAANAQRATKVYRIGFVSPTGPGPRDQGFLQGLRDLGYADGENVSITLRFAEGRYERLPGLVQEMIGAQVDVLVVGATIGARAAKNATTTIPVVFAGSSDPVAGGIVSNLARPEGNITGTSYAFGGGFAGKWLELLKEAFPALTHVATLETSVNAPAAARFVKELKAVAQSLRVKLEVYHATTLPRLQEAFAAIGRSGARGLIVTPSPFAATNSDRFIQFAASERAPAMYFFEDFPRAGGLMSYGPSIREAYRRAALYVDKILKGAKPGDLPVEQPTRFELVINLKTAKSLGLTVAPTLLLRADTVIE